MSSVTDHPSTRKTARRVYALASSHDKAALLMVFAAMISATLLEAISAAAVSLLATALASPEEVLAFSMLKPLWQIVPAAWYESPKELVLTVTLGALFCVVAKNCMTCVLYFFSSKFSERFSRKIGGRLLAGFLKSPFSWHMKKNPADIILAFQWRQQFGAFIMAILMFGSNVLTVGFLLCLAVLASPFMSLTIIGVCGFFGAVAFLVIKRPIDALGRDLVQRQKNINAEVTKALHGIKDVKLYQRERFFEEDYDVEARALGRLMVIRGAFTGAPTWVLESLGFMVLVGVVYYFLQFRNLTVADATSALAIIAAAAWRILPAINKIVDSATRARLTLPLVVTCLDYIDETCQAYEKRDDEQPRADIHYTERLSLERLTYRYEDAQMPALSQIDIAIPKGSSLGVVGRSGAGKSTLVNCLTGLLQPESGAICLDGVPLAPQHRSCWLSQIGYVAQHPYIMNGTLAENIAFSERADSLDRDRVLRCCKMAAIDFLEQLDNGIDTEIGERGIRLSGGQLQRIAIARALYNEPDILIFDEATSALDKKNEMAIQQTVEELSENITTILIAHRLSTVEHCDQVAWFEDGRIRMLGKPEEVLHQYRMSVHDDG